VIRREVIAIVAVLHIDDRVDVANYLVTAHALDGTGAGEGAVTVDGLVEIVRAEGLDREIVITRPWAEGESCGQEGGEGDGLRGTHGLRSRGLLG
jgi:hypothetical protein